MTLIVASNAALFTYHVKHQSKGEQAQEKQIQNDQAQQNQDQKFTTPKPRCQMLPMFPTWCNQERPMNRHRHRHRHQPKMDVPQGSTESSRDQALQELQRFFPSVVKKDQENKTNNDWAALSTCICLNFLERLWFLLLSSLWLLLLFWFVRFSLLVLGLLSLFHALISS